MTLRLVFRPSALEEFSGAAEWYGRRSSGLSAEFLRSLDATEASIVRNPLQYPVVRGVLRRALLRRFPYSLIYSVTDSEIIVVGCVHWRRHPRHWRNRR